MTNPWEIQEQTNSPPRKAGRPKGVPNKSVLDKLIIDQFNSLYNDIEPSLTPEQKKYFKEAFNSREEFDPLVSIERLAKLFDIYAITVTVKGIKEQRASKEVAEIINQYRQICLNIEDIRRKREEVKDKDNDEGRMVDPTRKSTLGRFQGIHRES